jgi:uncharacterized membrane protein
MTKKISAIAFSLFACVLFAACSKDSGDNNNGNNNGGNNGGGGTNPGPLFTAARSIVQTNCAVSGCHTGSSAQSGINFSNDNTIVAQKDRIKVRAVDQAGTANQMPPPPRAALSTANQQAITNWIAAGGRITD